MSNTSVTDVTAWSFVVPNYNGAKVIRACVDSLLSAASDAREAGEIIVVDDASSDGSVEILSGYGDKIRLIKLEKNGGFSTACNAGIFAARGRVVILVNNDVQARPGLIAGALSHFADGEIFAVSFKAVDENGDLRIGRVIPKFKKGFLKGVPDEGGSGGDGAGATFFASGGGAAFCAEKLRALGGFDECMNPFYWEDVDLSYRALKRGWKVVYDPSCLIFHPSHGVISSSCKRREADIISRRNQLVFFWKNVDDAAMIASHVFHLVFKLASGVAVFRFDYIKSFAAAAGRARFIMDFRRKEKPGRRKSDREILRSFSGKRD